MVLQQLLLQSFGPLPRGRLGPLTGRTWLESDCSSYLTSCLDLGGLGVSPLPLPQSTESLSQGRPLKPAGEKAA